MGGFAEKNGRAGSPLPAASLAETAWPMVKLGDVCEVQRGIRVTRKDLLSDGKYKVYQNSLKPLGGYNAYNCEAGNPFMIMAMAAGEVGFSDEPFWAADDCTYFKNPRDLYPKYLYFLLLQNKDALRRNVKQTTIPRLSNKSLEALTFPLPPLSVQREIVERLEKELGEAEKVAAGFRRIAENAEAEFKAELDETFKALEDDVSRGGAETRRVRLGDVCDIRRGRVMSRKYLEAHPGRYPVYSSQTFNNGVFGYIDTFDCDGEYITWTTDGANAGSVFYHNEKFSITNVCGLLSVSCNGVSARWLEYSLKTKLKKFVNISVGNPKLMSNVVATVPVEIPSCSLQHAIVSRLDAARERCNKIKAEAEKGLKAAENLRKAILKEAFER